LPYFRGISLEDVVSLVDVMQPGEHPPGSDIVTEGDRFPPPLYIATVGRVLITKKNADGEERELAQLKSPTLFGEIELFCQIPPVATARALDRVCTFVLTRSKFDQLFAARHPAIMHFTFNVARVACHRLAIADAMLAQVLKDADLVTLRQAVFSQMAEGKDWGATTGMFTRINDE
jgi:CRP-like cAMP-binding protein